MNASKRQRKAIRATGRMQRTMEVVNYRVLTNCGSIVHSFKNEQIYRENVDCEKGRERTRVHEREKGRKNARKRKKLGERYGKAI